MSMATMAWEQFRVQRLGGVPSNRAAKNFSEDEFRRGMELGYEYMVEMMEVCQGLGSRFAVIWLPADVYATQRRMPEGVPLRWELQQKVAEAGIPSFDLLPVAAQDPRVDRIFVTPPVKIEFCKKAKRKDSRHVLSKLGEEVNGSYQIIDDRPWIVPSRHMSDLVNADEVMRLVEDGLDTYLKTVPDHLRALLTRYRIIDAALKVVGVGSVGTRCFIVLLQGRGRGDPERTRLPGQKFHHSRQPSPRA